MRGNAATQVEEVIDALATLDDEQRSLVLDFARMLRARVRTMVPDDLSPTGADYLAWQAAVDVRARQALAEFRRRVEAAGLSPDAELSRSEWPADMAPGSRSSVET
ncbi:MAG: hypothetical protein Q8S73_34920 [Deltaproteobacteria bacterium]|nr:hypothetical protein [Myxococcales bacterium]MDP3219345.1 hypothetical protein [Deltaproteobacteria bacterium]